jgi:oligosaccharide repeat unit polymerase
MIPIDLALILFSLLVICNYLLHRSVLYPPFVFCAMWLLDLVVIRSNAIQLDPIHANTLEIVGAGALAFSLGGIAAGLVPRALLRVRLLPLKSLNTPDALRTALTLILLLSLPVMFYQVWLLANQPQSVAGLLVSARVNSVQMNQNEEPSLPIFILGYFSSIAMYTALLFNIEKRDRKSLVVTIVAIIAGILATGRTDLLLLLSGLGAITLLQKKQENLLPAFKLLRWPVALFLALWIALLFTNKSTQDTGGGVVAIATSALLVYMTGPLAAFDKVVQHPAEFAIAANHTFQFPLRVAADLHLAEYIKPQAFDAYVFVPFPMNVYTVFKFYLVELGISGTLALLLLIGFLHSLLYLRAREGGRFSTYLFAYFMYPLVMVIFDDHYYLTGLIFRAIGFGALYFLAGSMRIRLFSSVPHFGTQQSNAEPVSPLASSLFRRAT